MRKHKIFAQVLLLFLFVTDVQPWSIWASECQECSKDCKCDINFLTHPTIKIAEEMTTIELQCYIDKYPKDLLIFWKKINPPSWPNREAQLANGVHRLIETR